MKRTGMEVVKDEVVVVKEEVVVVKDEVVVVKDEVVVVKEEVVVPKKLAWTKEAPKFVPPQMQSDKEVVLRVPANMATQAIELALKSGISVRVEVI